MILIATTLIALLALSAPSDAQITRPGQCPQVTVAFNFNLSVYMGLWYEIQRYEAPFQQSLECVTASYSLAEENVARVTMINRGLRFDGTNATVVEAQAVAVPSYPNDNRAPAMLSVAYYGEPSRSNYWILGTDYRNYALVYWCNQVTDDTYKEHAWVLARTKNPSAESWSKIYGLIAANNITPEDFRLTDQSGRCLSG